MSGDEADPVGILALYQTAAAAGNNLWIFHITVCVFIVGLFAERGNKIGWYGRALLAFAFACFAVGTYLPILNAHLLSVALAEAHNQTPIGGIALRTFSTWYVTALHLVADVLVLSIILLWRRPGRPAPSGT